jgi:hypothetical protein
MVEDPDGGGKSLMQLKNDTLLAKTPLQIELYQYTDIL